MEPDNRQRWPRITLVLPPDAADALGTLARNHFRDRRREALRLLLDAIERERIDAGGAAR
jgi:hypothetical protein